MKLSTANPQQIHSLKKRESAWFNNNLLRTNSQALNPAKQKNRRADPAASKHQEEWRAAMEALILVAASGGPTMFARIGVMRALNRHVERVFNPDHKEHHWGRRNLARGR
jgi:hypothetical protein